MVSWRRSASWLSSASRSSLGGAVGGEAKVTPEVDPAAQEVVVEEEEVDEERWSRLLPELLTEIVRRVDAGAERWPLRRDVVVCACVCRRWRDAAFSVVRPPLEGGRITFPSSLKQVRPRRDLLVSLICLGDWPFSVSREMVVSFEDLRHVVMSTPWLLWSCVFLGSISILVKNRVGSKTKNPMVVLDFKL